MIRRPPRSTQSRSSAASDVYKRQHPGRAAGGNWREPGEAGRGAGQGPGVTLNPSALVPTPAEITQTRPHFLTTVPQNGQVGVWEIFFVSRWGPRPNSKRAIIDERGSKISEDLIYFCDLGSPFSEKMCWICCKGSQILTSRYLLAAASGSYRKWGSQCGPGPTFHTRRGSG